MNPRKIYFISKILLLTLVVPLIFLLMFFYYKTFPLKILPEGFEKYNISPEEFAVVILANDVIERLSKKNLRGYAMCAENIEGPQTLQEIEGLVITFNSVLAKYDGWSLLADKKQTELLKQRKKLDFESKKELIKAGLIDPQKYVNFLIASDLIKVNYDIMLKWRFATADRILCELVCEIINRATMVKEVVSSVVFTNPAVYKKYTSAVKFLTYASYISSGYISVILFFVFTSAMYIELKKKSLLKILPLKEEEINKLIKNGSYTSALKTIEQLLNFFPESSWLIALKERLLIVTKNEPKKAEQAYVRYVNLKTKLARNIILSDEETQQLKSLPDQLALPEINELVAKYERYINALKLRQQINAEVQYIKMLTEAGELSKAETELDSLSKAEMLEEYKNVELQTKNEDKFLTVLNEDIKSLRVNIRQKLKTSMECLEKAKNLISYKGSITEAENLLRSALKNNMDLKEARTILTKIEKSKKAKKLHLLPEKVGKHILIFKKDSITFFRKDKKLPDVEIEDPRVSRDRHLKICILENKVIAEDEGSTNGTYYRGQKINRVELEDGDILNLANVYEIVIHIYRKRKFLHKTLIDSNNLEGYKLGQPAKTQLQKVYGIFIETKDINCIVLPQRDTSEETYSEVPVSFSLAGIGYDESSDTFISVHDNVIIFSTSKERKILCSDETIEYKGVSYRVTADV